MCKFFTWSLTIFYIFCFLSVYSFCELFWVFMPILILENQFLYLLICRSSNIFWTEKYYSFKMLQTYFPTPQFAFISAIWRRSILYLSDFICIFVTSRVSWYSRICMYHYGFFACLLKVRVTIYLGFSRDSLNLHQVSWYNYKYYALYILQFIHFSGG